MNYELLTLILSYFDMFFLLFAMSIMCVIFIHSEDKKEQLLWFGRALLVPVLLLASVINLFLLFSRGIQGLYDSALLERIGEFVSLLASLAFLVLIIGKKWILKFL